jgi:hypothetical protein
MSTVDTTDRGTGPKVRLARLSIDAIRPAPENALIYRPVAPDDPDIRELARSIGRYGLKQPITVTRDGYIISGHRRHAACRLLGMQYVPCYVEPISHRDPRFEIMLCEHNRQRVKTFDEVVREQVIITNPAEAYRSLIEHRRAGSAVNGEFIRLGEVKRRKVIGRLKRPMLEAIRGFVEGQRPYWAISDREVHYGLLNDPPVRNANKGNRYTNDLNSYNDTTDMLTRARLEGHIPFYAIGDETRTVCTWDNAHRSVGGFIGQELDGFLKGYWRELQQSQPNHVEIIGEKNTIEGSIRDIAMRYCIPYTLGRGYCSLDPRYKMYQRFKASGKGRLIILIMSDFDPEGEDIAYSFTRSMRDDFGIEEEKIRARKVCLTHDQVLERNLPVQFDIKKEGSRYKKFAAKYGDRAHELEALPTAERQRLLTEAIDSVIDIDAFNRELDLEREDAVRLATLRETVVPSLIAASARASL